MNYIFILFNALYYNFYFLGGGENFLIIFGIFFSLIYKVKYNVDI